jgi:hypothetical protein
MSLSIINDKNDKKELINSAEVDWTSEHEEVLAEWADKSMCYNWLHTKSNEKYSARHKLYTIPVIIMSTLTGTANFAQDKIPLSFRNYATMIIGAINIFAGIITTIQQFLKINELNEGHRVASVSWDKFYRRIKVELSKSPKERHPVKEFFITATEEYDRLMEAGPKIDHDIIELFNMTFNGKNFNSLKHKPSGLIGALCISNVAHQVMEDPSQNCVKKREKFDVNEISKPEICDSLISVKYSIYKQDEKSFKKNIFNKVMVEMTGNNKEKVNEFKEKLLMTFWNKFKDELNREPTEQEMIDNLAQDVENFNAIDEETISHFIERMNK